MKYEVFNGLSCPVCGSALALRESFVQERDEVLYGIVGCRCNEYPILDGILVLRSNGLSRWTVETLKNHKFAEALLLFFKWDAPIVSSLVPKNGNSVIVNTLQFLANLSKRRLALEADSLTFRQLVEKLRLGRYGNYLIHRFSCHTFWNVYALLPLLNNVGGPILDFGCGAGHASFVFSHFLQPSNIFCVDANFLNLFLAKEYCVNSEFVCVDDGSSLPFADDFFAFVFCLDAFHYVKSKISTASELQRVLKKKGALALAHLHNAIKHNINSGAPLPASSYSKFFDSLKTAVFPEDQMLVSFLCKDLVALSDACSQKDIDSFDTLTLVASRSQEPFAEYRDVKQYLLSMKESLIINPLYGLAQTSNDYQLKRCNPDRMFMKEFYLTERTLPKMVSMKKSVAEAILKHKYEGMEKEINKLIESFVLINAPNRY